MAVDCFVVCAFYGVAWPGVLIFCERWERGCHAKTINFTKKKKTFSPRIAFSRTFEANSSKWKSLGCETELRILFTHRERHQANNTNLFQTGRVGRLFLVTSEDLIPNQIYFGRAQCIYFYTFIDGIRRQQHSWGRSRRRVALELCSKCNSSDVRCESLCSPWISKAFWMCTAFHWRFRSGRDNRDLPCASPQRHIST